MLDATLDACDRKESAADDNADSTDRATDATEDAEIDCSERKLVGLLQQ
jgi:hypothetical protein